MKKLLFIAGILLLASCSKDEIFLEMEEQMELVQKDTTNINPSSTTNSKSYTLHKESYLNQRSGIAFTWSEHDSRVYGYQPNLIYKGDRHIAWWAGGQAYHDVNGDGLQDILVTNHNKDGSWTCWFINKGNNQDFESDESYILNSTEGYSSYKFIKTDVNNDNRADFIAFGVDERVEGAYTGNLTVFIQTEQGKFLVNDIPNPKKLWFHTGAAGDLNNDGFVDLVGGDRIWYGDGRGNFKEDSFGFTTISNAVLAYEILDINKDGLNDIILGTQTEHGTDFIMLNNGKGFGSDNKIIYLPKTNYSGIMDIELIDIDSDNDLDIVELRQGSDNKSTMFLYTNDNLKFTLNEDYFGNDAYDGNFTNGSVDRYGWSRFKFDDVDGDGIDEIIAENYQDGQYNALKKIDGVWKKVLIKFGK